MLDRAATLLIKPVVDRMAAVLAGMGMGANQMTLLGVHDRHFRRGADRVAVLPGGRHRDPAVAAV